MFKCLEKMIYTFQQYSSELLPLPLHSQSRITLCHQSSLTLLRAAAEHFFACLTMHKSRGRASNRNSLSHSESNVYARLFTAWKGEGRSKGLGIHMESVRSRASVNLCQKQSPLVKYEMTGEFYSPLARNVRPVNLEKNVPVSLNAQSLSRVR